MLFRRFCLLIGSQYIDEAPVYYGQVLGFPVFQGLEHITVQDPNDGLIWHPLLAAGAYYLVEPD